MTRLLPPEILNIVFKEIHDEREGRFSNLSSCARVDRTWCTSAIPLLWSDPFETHGSSRECVINIYLAFLNTEELGELRNNGVPIFDLPNHPILNYPSFLKTFNHQMINNAIYSWCECYGVIDDDIILKYVRGAFIKVLCKCDTNLRTLYCSTEFVVEYNLLQSNFHSVIASVNKMYIDLKYIDIKFLSYLSQACQQVNYLEIYFSLFPRTSQDAKIEADSLATLIRYQVQLQRIHIYRCYQYVHLIIDALQHQSGSLREVVFHQVNFQDCGPLHGLATCKYLEHLEIGEGCQNLTEEMCRPLFDASFVDLHVVLYNGINYSTDPFNFFHCKELVEWAEKQCGTNERTIKQHGIPLKCLCTNNVKRPRGIHPHHVLGLRS
ncbi:4389_t:CDS:2 [Dentiscutata erythropus]|uniref:4389_t:CDS:1 n=1 Tax=Dentiscutata erythropus TaxID=1348616 RepID=A0A9N9DGH0_9GLOM|nr:4389_t:CDS:2 [Dentiscutata erythropus]